MNKACDDNSAWGSSEAEGKALWLFLFHQQKRNKPVYKAHHHDDW